MNSIRQRLLLWLTGATAFCIFLVGMITLDLTREGFDKTRDYALEQIAYSILQYGVEPIGSPSDVQFISTIWDTHGQLVFTSRPDIDLPRLQPGSHQVEWKGEEWHVFTLTSSEATVQVANTSANRTLMFSQLSSWLLLPLGVLIGLLGTILWLAIGEALSPFDSIRKEIGKRDITCLKKLPQDGYPREVTPLIETLNTLLERIDRVLSSQRRFIADAAHELRTPLTAIKLQTQIARDTTVESDRADALDLLQGSVDRATRLVEQLLQLARFDPEFSASRRTEPVRLDDLARTMIIAFSPNAEAIDVDLGLDHCEATTVNADPESLRIMLGNLIDNALRYARDGGRIDVDVRSSDGHAVLDVTDRGPGIPDGEKTAVFERFHRYGSPDIFGSGLGLAIVKEIAEQHHGQVQLVDNPGGGLIVRVTLPLLPMPTTRSS